MFRWPKNNTQPWENHETNISVETTYILIDHIIISIIYPSRGPWSLMILRAHTVFRYRFSCFLAFVRGFLVFEEIDVRVLIPLTHLPTLVRRSMGIFGLFPERQAIATCQLWARCSLHDVKWWTIPGGTYTKENLSAWSSRTSWDWFWFVWSWSSVCSWGGKQIWSDFLDFVQSHLTKVLNSFIVGAQKLA